MDTIPRNRRRSGRMAVIAAGVTAMLALSACGGSGQSGAGESGSAGGSGTLVTNDPAYDAIVNAGPVADDATIEGNEWAKAVKANGTLRVGGVETATLFSILDPVTGTVTGFDAGLGQMLSRYIFGDASKYSLTQVTMDTREELLVNKQVDVVTATYSITPERLERIDFAGPYYQSASGVLVSKSNTDIQGVKDLAGKTVATQAGSTGEPVLAKFAPDAKVVSLPDHTQCIEALKQGRVDAYVIDETLLLTAAVQNDDLKVVGEPFGDSELYGFGVPKGSDATEFINDFFRKIEKDGTWTKLWKETIQKKTGVETVATPPEIGVTKH